METARNPTGSEYGTNVFTSPASQSGGAVSATEILNSLRHPIEPIQVTVGYRLAIAVVASLMVLLPVIYLGLIGLVGWGVYWHLVTNTFILTADVRGKAKLFTLLGYLAPAIVGVILVAFMLKPLFAKRRARFEPQSIRRDQEPFLFDFVDALCDAVGSPRPKSILLDDEVNAAAALTSSVWNPFRNDLLLVIGLPLVAGMSLRQFGGILAHEFGHFSQGAGMRLGLVIHAINRWFGLVVYQRDSWDDQLEAWTRDSDLRYGWVLWLTCGGVWLTRKILYGLMLLGEAMSCRLSREMEFDADRHEARFAGSDNFRTTSQRLPILIAARQWAIGDLSSSYCEGRLVDDFFQLVAIRAGMISEEDRRELIEARLNAPTKWFYTHPSDAERIASAEREQAPGVFQIESPASVLFQDFAATSRAETLTFYQWQLGEAIAPKSLVPAAELVAEQQAKVEQDDAAERVLGGLYHYYCRLSFSDDLTPSADSIPDVLATIINLRTHILGLAAAHGEAVNHLREQYTFDQEANLAELLLIGGMSVGSDVFRVPLTSHREIALVREQITSAKAEGWRSLAAMYQVFTDRLRLPLQLLGVPEVAAKIPDAQSLWDESNHLIRSLITWQKHHETLLEIYDSRELIQDVSKQLEGRDSHPTLLTCLRKATEQGIAKLQSVQPSFASVRYPFLHVERDMSVGQYLINQMPPQGDPSAVHSALTNVMMEGFRLNTRMVGRLCAIAEKIETALGLPLGEKPQPTVAPA